MSHGRSSTPHECPVHAPNTPCTLHCHSLTAWRQLNLPLPQFSLLILIQTAAGRPHLARVSTDCCLKPYLMSLAPFDDSAIPAGLGCMQFTHRCLLWCLRSPSGSTRAGAGVGGRNLQILLSSFVNTAFSERRLIITLHCFGLDRCGDCLSNGSKCETGGEGSSGLSFLAHRRKG